MKACSWILIYIYLCIGILLSLHILKRWSSGHTPLGVSALLLICMANLLVLFSSLYVHIKLWLLRKEYSAERFDGAICILFKWFSSILSEKKKLRAVFIIQMLLWIFSYSRWLYVLSGSFPLRDRKLVCSFKLNTGCSHQCQNNVSN